MRPLTILAIALARLAFIAPSAAQQPSPSTEKIYANLCAPCHGANAGGTDRGPALTESRSLRGRTLQEIRGIIRDGTQAGMPAFPLPEPELQALAQWVHSLNTSAFDLNPPGVPAAGKQFFLKAA